MLSNNLLGIESYYLIPLK